MPANNLPKMPEAVGWQYRYGTEISGWSSWKPWIPEEHDPPFPGMIGRWAVQYRPLHDGRACYLAGIEAARGCVPQKVAGWRAWGVGFNDCCDKTLANLEALKNESVADKSADALGRE